jgi:hypothetical protein
MAKNTRLSLHLIRMVDGGVLCDEHTDKARRVYYSHQKRDELCMQVRSQILVCEMGWPD